MSATELSAYIGRKGSMHNRAGLQIPVEVFDARSSWGRTDVLIQREPPVWVNADKIRFEE